MEDTLNLIGAVDQGTSSTRFLIFDARTAAVVCSHQIDIAQSFPQEGWVEEDPLEIVQSVHECIEKATDKLQAKNISLKCIKAIGITNQRETTIVWDKNSGKPLHPAIVWCDNRTTSTVDQLIASTPTKKQDYLQKQCGLPISTYFSAVKLKWLMDNKLDVHESIKKGDALFGTVDSWLLWNMTGGVDCGVHVTDITNASRTMLFNINTQLWDDDLCKFFGVPKSILPNIKSSAEVYGKMSEGPLKDLPLSGCLGDQQAALVGQICLSPGDCKNTYGTGCFLLQNTGTTPIISTHGLLTTIAYKLGPDEPTYYAMEGSVAIAGGLVRWLRDNLEIINDSEEIETLANSVGTSGDVFFVPAFAGLYAPYWRSDARGIICGLTQYSNKAHIAFAALEAVCFQTREIIDAMVKDASTAITTLQVDGGMTVNDLLMQLQADILGVTVLKPSMLETTALGAAMAAGKAIGVWSLDKDDLASVEFKKFEPKSKVNDIKKRFAKWKLAVQKSMNWNSDDA